MRHVLETRRARDLLLICGLLLAVWGLAATYDLFDRLYPLVRRYQHWHLDDLLLLLLILPLPLLWYMTRRLSEAGTLAARQMQGERQKLQSSKVESLEVMANGLSHELNNELQPVIGLASLLEQQEHPDERHRRQTRLIAEGAVRARDTIVRVMGLSDSVRPPPTPIAISLPLHNLLDALAQSCPADVHLRGDIDDEVPVPNIAWPDLETIVTNLVANAVEATEAGGGTILVRLQRLAGVKGLGPDYVARLQVIDQGVGIAPDDRDRICDPFFTRKPVGLGAGLGLWQVQMLVARAGGQLRFTSTPGAGTEVSILLPALRPGAPQWEGS